MAYKDYYDVLGVPRTVVVPGAEEENRSRFFCHRSPGPVCLPTTYTIKKRIMVEVAHLRLALLDTPTGGRIG